MRERFLIYLVLLVAIALLVVVRWQAGVVAHQRQLIRALWVDCSCEPKQPAVKEF